MGEREDAGPIGGLRAYVPRLLESWLADDEQCTHREVVGTLAFVDLSGFTALTERLARRGKVGAEEMSDALNDIFGQLMEVADRDGADLVKWGGDAILLLYEGDEHAQRACRSAFDMRSMLRRVGVVRPEGGGTYRLRMSVGIHSGTFDFFLVGDPALHRELLVTGPAASEAARLEGLAVAGQVLVGRATAGLLAARYVGAAVGEDAFLLRGRPDVAGEWRQQRVASELDVRGFIPVAIREHLLAGRGIPEHRAVAVAFVQFAGTDAMLRDQGPEATAAALDDLVRNVSHACHAHGVTFFETDINVDGGKIMLTAGAPRTAGHDADRLLRAARRMLDHGAGLPLRIGVNVGRVFSSDFGPAFRRTYSIKGDAVNTAARIMGKAEVGQLLATLPARDAAETRFETREVGPFVLKGKKLPLHAVSIERVVADRVEERDELPLVGREAELGVLLGAAADSREGRGRVVELLGEPGIGKSRLVQELIHRARDLVVAQAVCDEYQQATAYGVFRDLLQARFGINDRTPPDVASSMLRRSVTQLAPDLEPWLPLVGSMLDVTVPETPWTRDLDPQFRKQRLEMVLVDLIGRMLPGPSLLVVDDAQYLDAAGADLLNQLALGIAERPWLLVVNRRDEPVGWVPAEGLPTTRLHLEALDREHSLALAAQAAGEQHLPRQVLEAMSQRAAGNPLFLQALAEQTAQAGRSNDAGDLPSTIEDLVSAQIDQLSPQQRTVLRHAAVLGNQFGTNELTELLDDHDVRLDDELIAELDGFLISADGGTQLRFRHGLIRETAYAGLAYRSRRNLHRWVGESMERAGRGEAEPELLSLHFLHAGSYGKAFRYARTGGEEASRMYANVEAVELFGRAVEAGRRLPRGEVPDHELARVHEAMGDCWFRIGPAAPAAEAYAAARARLHDRPCDVARIAAQEARLDHRQRHFPQSLGRLTRALHALEGHDGPEVDAARSVLEATYAAGRVHQGRADDAIAWGERAVRSAESSGDAASMARAYANLHGLLQMTGRRPDPDLGQRALEMYIDTGDLMGQAMCTNNLAVDAVVAYQWPEALAQYGVAAEIYRRLGDTSGEAMARGNIGEVLVNQGRLAEAWAALEPALESAQAAGDVDLEAFALLQQGRALARGGAAHDGLELLDRVRGMLIAIDEPEELRRVDLARVEALLLDQDPDRAITLADTLLADPEEEAYTIEADLHLLRGHALLALGRPDEAEAEFRAGVAAGVTAGDVYPVAGCRLALADLGVPDAAEMAAAARPAVAQLGLEALPFGEVRSPVGSSGRS